MPEAAAAAAGPTFGNQSDVAELTGGAVGAQDQAAFAHDCAAQTSRHGHVQEVGTTTGGAEPVLGHPRLFAGEVVSHDNHVRSVEQGNINQRAIGSGCAGCITVVIVFGLELTLQNGGLPKQLSVICIVTEQEFFMGFR